MRPTMPGPRWEDLPAALDGFDIETLTGGTLPHLGNLHLYKTMYGPAEGREFRAHAAAAVARDFR